LAFSLSCERNLYNIKNRGGDIMRVREFQRELYARELFFISFVSSNIPFAGNECFWCVAKA
jgi:hypothetical protein